jgi:hypothetical protein
MGNSVDSGGMGNSGGGMGSGMGGANPFVTGTALPQNFEQWIQALFPFNPLDPAGWSMQPSLSMFLTRAEMLLTMYALSPAQLFEAIVMLGLQFVIHRTLVLINLVLFNPGGLLTFFVNNPFYTLGLASPFLAAPAGAASGLAGLAATAPVVPPAQPMPLPAATIPVAGARTVPTTISAMTNNSSGAHTPVTSPASTAAAPANSPPPPPPVAGSEGGAAAQGIAHSYLVGVLGSASALSNLSKTPQPTPDVSAAGEIAAAPPAPQPRGRQRRTAATRRDRGYRYEFLDSENELGGGAHRTTPVAQVR